MNIMRQLTDEEIRVSLRLREDKIKQKISFFKRISSIPTNFEQFNFENAVVDSKQEQEVKAKLEYYCDNFKKAKNILAMNGCFIIEDNTLFIYKF